MTATATSVRGRRWVLLHAGKGFLGLAVLGLAAACSADDDAGTTVVSGPGHSGSAAGLDWWRVDFAYVSAYVLVRAREAALVDCGLGSRVDAIGAVLGAAGTGWDRVRHVLITHVHTDHHDGLTEVAARAPGAATSPSSTPIRGCSSPVTRSPTPSTGCKARWRTSAVTCGQPKSRFASSPLWSLRSSSSATVPPSSKTPPHSCDGWPVPHNLTTSPKVLGLVV